MSQSKNFRHLVGTRFKLNRVGGPDQVVGDIVSIVEDDGAAHPFCYFFRTRRVHPVQIYEDEFAAPQATLL